MESCLLLIFAPPALEESMVDWLLESETIAGFSTMQGFGHGSRAAAMSLVEQVAGRQRRVLFLVEAPQREADQLIDQLKQQFAGAGLHYVMMPLLAAGKI